MKGRETKIEDQGKEWKKTKIRDQDQEWNSHIQN